MASRKPFFRLDSYVIVRKVLLLIYVLSMTMGFTIQIYNSTKKRVYTSKIFAFYGIFLSFIPMSYYKSTGLLFKISGKRSMVLNVVHGIEAVLLFYVMLLGTIRRYMSRRSIEELFDDFMSIQKVIGYTPAEIYRTTNKKVLKMVVISSTLLVIPIVLVLVETLKIEELPLDVLGLFTSMYPKVMIVNLGSWYYLQVIYIHRYLELANLMLSGLHQKVAHELQIISFGKCSQKHSKKLHRIMMMRSRIIDLAFKFNKTYTVQMVVIFTLISVLTLSQLYFLFLSAYRSIENPGSITPYMTLTTFFCFILNLYIAFCIADACELTMEESKKTSNILHRYNSLNMDVQLKQTVEIFLIQLMHHPIKFTACGMFTLDYTVLFSIITSATSYLIILIQFELANNCDKN